MFHSFVKLEEKVVKRTIEDFENPENNPHLLVKMEDIWAQIDADLDRLMMSFMLSSSFELMQESLNTVSSGTFIVTKSEILWFGIGKDSLSAGKPEVKLAMEISTKDIVRFSVGTVKRLNRRGSPVHRQTGDNVSSIKNTRRNLSHLKKSMIDDVNKSPESIVDMLFSDEEEEKGDDDDGGGDGTSGGGGGNFQRKGSSAKAVPSYYMMFQTRSETYRFYPFLEAEIAMLTRSMTMATEGLKPFVEADFVKSVLVSKQKRNICRAFNILCLKLKITHSTNRLF